MERLDPLSYDANKLRMDDGTVAIATHDPTTAGLLRDILAALLGIRARLDAGINTKVVTSLATVTV